MKLASTSMPRASFFHGAALVLTCCWACSSPDIVNGTGGSGSQRSGGAGGTSGPNLTGGPLKTPDNVPTGTAGSGSGNGNGTTSDGKPCGQIIAVVRDFRTDHADFEKDDLNKGLHRGLVKPELGADQKPVYAASGPTPVTSGPDAFAQWYRDVDGVNIRFEVPILLAEKGPGQFVFEDNEFFPLNGKGFSPADDRLGRNFGFTTEIHTTFLYKGGERFTFTGDDDVFVFVNGKLVIDLGGVHGKQNETVDFDARAAELGIEKGKSYSLDVFHAERHTSQSNFRIETSIGCLQARVIP